MTVLLGSHKVPNRYVPSTLTPRDAALQKKYLIRSRKAYSKNRSYINRPSLRSFTSKASSHVQRATAVYGVSSMVPNRALVKATGCSRSALKKIIKKGEGAYYSSGSRPNQTPQSWGYARLASALTGGPSSLIDYSILKEGCSRRSRPIMMANRLRNTTRKNSRNKL
jgi:hypothetical protein